VRPDNYLVVPLIEGQSLENKLLDAEGQPLLLQEALRISQEVLLALDYAHRQRVIHRDVKPSNILLDAEGRAYLADFGIALLMGQERITRGLTRGGSTIGTAEYMSPEQIITPKKIDHRADVYSFGCVLYEMLTGQPPFKADDESGESDDAVKFKHVHTAPTPISTLNPDVPAEIERIVMCALAKKADDRFGGCGEFARQLEQAQKQQPLVHRDDAMDKLKKAEARADELQKKLQSTPTLASASRSKRWKIATVVLSLLLICACVGVGITYDKYKKMTNDRNSQRFMHVIYKNEAESLRNEVESLKTEKAELWGRIGLLGSSNKYLSERVTDLEKTNEKPPE